MADLRTRKTAAKYRKFIASRTVGNGCDLCKSPHIKSFKHWKIIKDDFPWDRIAKVHHMIIPKKHVTEEKLTEVERKELLVIKVQYISPIYEVIAEATNRKKSVLDHFHLHLIIPKDNI